VKIAGCIVFAKLKICHLQKYLPTIKNGESLITSLEKLGVSEPRFEFQYREFENQKVCYLPFNSFFLKPMQRLVHYKVVLERKHALIRTFRVFVENASFFSPHVN